MQDQSYMKRRNFVLTNIVILFSLILSGFAWAFKSVYIQVDGRRVNVHTLSNNPQEVIKQAGIVLQPNDEYYVNGNIISNGTSIEICRAVPVFIAYQGKTETVTTGKRTVGEILNSLGISLNGIKVEPAGQARVLPGRLIKAVTIKEESVDTEELVSFPVIREPDPELDFGTEQIMSQGTNGVKIVSTKLRYEDGVKVSETVLSEKVISEPKPCIIKTGTRNTVQTSRGAVSFRNSMQMRASAYTPYDGQQTGVTATGVPARHGIAAVDPKVIPLGSRLYVQGYGFALAADTGGAIVGNAIDLCMESHNEAMNFGRRTVKVYILN